jgi:coiled-coil domain-containing protein 55
VRATRRFLASHWCARPWHFVSPPVRVVRPRPQPLHLPNMSLKFGFNLKNKPPNGPAKAGAKPALGKKKKPLLGDEEEDVKGKAKAADDAQEIAEFNFDDTITSTESSKPAPSKPKKGQPIAPPTRKPKPKDDDPTLLESSASAKEAAQRAQDALAADSTLYDYDAAYEVLHAASALKKAAEAADPSAQQPKYMAERFAAAEQRKADQQRARDKLLARERENEGDEFADKEKFVTSAYKTQQEQALIDEAAEQKRLAAEEENRRKFGMQDFHKKMLAERERQHNEAMAAAAAAAKSGIKIPAIGDDESKKTEQQIVAELRAQGKDILMNEDGGVADKRQLLSAGLNIIAKPKPPPTSTTAAKPIVMAPSVAKSGGRNAQRERQTAMVAQQIEAAAKRKADEEAEQEAKLLHASKSQKTATDIMSAKERYLARKAEAAAAKEKGGK